MSEARVWYCDMVPYQTPSSLKALHGPGSGLLEVPVTVHWGPRRVFDLDEVGQRRSAYQAIVREGTPPVQEALLNAGLLAQVWPELVLPVRCRTVWEHRFHRLTG
jgi:hypothetical protein